MSLKLVEWSAPFNDANFRATVEALSDPKSYPDSADETIEAIETHMSWVFMTTEHVYKLKKPVKKDCIDFLTPERRKYFCEEEIRLNKRLAKNTYLGVVKLTRTRKGKYTVGGRAAIVDYLVKMQRLDASRMLDAAIVQHRVTRPELDQIVSTLVNFFNHAEVISLSADSYQQKITAKVRATGLKLSERRYQLPIDQIEYLAAALLRYADLPQSLLRQRASNGHIVNGHGDLRTEHVFLGPPVQIIDCIEFNKSLRQNDPIDEIAFLAMECERLGAEKSALALLSSYQHSSDDRVAVELISFYQCYRGYIRALLAIEHLDDRQVNDPHHWYSRAQQYLALARQKSTDFTPSTH